MKQLLGITLVLLCFDLVSACGSTLSDQCEFTKTCPIPCDDASFAQGHPELCPRDAATMDAKADAGDAGDGSGSEGATAGDEPSEIEGSVSEDGPAAMAPDADASAGSETDAPETGRGDAAPVDASSGEAEAAACDGAAFPSVSTCVIDEAFGIFVSPAGSDTAAGTRGAPLRTIGRAMAVAKSAGKRVYACDNGNHFPETVTIDTSLDGVALFGGFACGSWTYSMASKATVNASTGSALVVRGTTSGVLVENFVFQAPSATGVGASSIGAIVDGSNGVVLRRVTVLSGDAAVGANGSNGMAGDPGPTAGSAQNGMRATCAVDAGFSQSGGGWSAPSTCAWSGGARGGVGGAGAQGSLGTSGSAGTPGGTDNSGARNMPGGAGSPGTSGNLGAPVTSVGVFSNTGYTPAPAAGGGTNGTVGQGGGGGGGSDVPQSVPALANCLGASGGAGGMGGCGGQAGTGGVGGGASVALLVWMSQVTLDTCDLVAGNGGAGGRGGNGGGGGMGAAGGMGGAGLAADAGASIPGAGSGGMGGSGGAGGPGAGGNGGPSYALAYRGQAPSRTGVTVMPRSGGAVGLGGTAPGLVMAPSGALGPAADEFVIP